MKLPENEVRQALVAAYANVWRSLGASPGARALVLPNGDFFPDAFTGDEPSVQRLLDRLLEHAGLADMAIRVRFWADDADSSCGSGACGSCGPAQAEPEPLERLVDAGDAWQVNVSPAEAAQPVALSSTLCRAIALAVLREADPPPSHMSLDLAVDLSAVALGFGVLLLEGSHIYRKSCGGPSIARSTALGPSELALLLALSVAVSEQSPRSVRKHLSATQQAAFAEARVWADSNRALAQTLRRDPQRIAAGEFELHEPTSWLGRWLGGTARRAAHESGAQTLAELEAAFLNVTPVRALPKPRDPKFEEITRLVDEALSE